MDNHETLDIVNQDGQIVGNLSRQQAEQDNHTTANVLVFIFNSQAQVLVSLRSQTKKHFPGLWDVSACGGVQSAEDHAQTAARETKEETGLSPDLKYISSFLNVFPGPNNQQLKRFSHLYIGFSDGQPQINDEVDQFKYWQPQQLRQAVLASPDKYIPSFIVELDMAIAAVEKESL